MSRGNRAWMRHPARTLKQQRQCPTNLECFTTLGAAEIAIPMIFGWQPTTCNPWKCQQCGYYHISNPPGDKTDMNEHHHQRNED